MTDAPELKPCPFCGGAETYITGQGQVWRGVSGYSDPQYFTLTHHGDLSDAEDFPRCSIQFRARTYNDVAEFWNTRSDHALTPADAVAALEAVKGVAYAAGQKAVKVKPLVWEDWYWGDHFARTALGVYNVKGNMWRKPKARTKWEGPCADPYAAAQADYETRIRAAIMEDKSDE